MKGAGERVLLNLKLLELLREQETDMSKKSVFFGHVF